jgi:magnesium-transporting ATPase (P-type)
MKTMYEGITFVIAAAVYLFFHLRGGKTIGEMLTGTIMQLLTTAPYCIGFTWILTKMISYLHHGKELAWDRIARIFFAIGIFFGFFFALYENADHAENERLRQEQSQPSISTTKNKQATAR